MLTMEQNLLASGGVCGAVEHSIKEHVDDDLGLKNNAELLESITGISTATTALLLAKLGDTTQFSSAPVKSLPLRGWCHVCASRALRCEVVRAAPKLALHVGRSTNQLVCFAACHVRETLRI
jgi:hypothetical protein